MLRYNEDLRSLGFLCLAALLLPTLWIYGGQIPKGIWIMLYALQLLMAVVISTIVHNHQHLAIWKYRWMNVAMDNVLTVFYGFPVFAWVPTHNSNHHVHINKEPDYTKTYMASEKNNLLTLLTYPSMSGMLQLKAVGLYLKKLGKTNRSKFFIHLLQIFSLILWVGAALVLDWQKAIIYVIIPQQVSLFTVMVFNYIQHVHADEESEYNHSRNMTGKILNFLLLNNGYHTAHHLTPGVHWSRLKAKHKKVERHIDPSLNENNFAWFVIRVYFLAPFFPAFRTENMRLNRLERSGSK